MLVGHFAIALAGKRAAPTVSIGTLTLASMLPDLLGLVFILTGLEHWRMVPGARGVDRAELYDIALSHSLVMDVVWGLLFAGVYRWRRGDNTSAAIVFAAVVSHWVLDFISHKPDMLLAPGTSRVYGLGLWTSLPWTVAIEGGLWLAALIAYVGVARAKNRAGVYAFWGVVALLTASWISNFTAPAPPAAQSPTSGAIVALAFFSLIIAWAFWMNRLRPLRARVDRHTFV